MLLTSEQLDQFALGCEWTETRDGAWMAHRFPRALMPTYAPTDVLSTRRDCPSGVRLRFLTDSTRIDLEFRIESAAHPLFQGAIVVDGGEPVAYGPAESRAQWQGTVFRQTSRNLRTIEIWLPHLCVVQIIKLQLHDATVVREAPRPSIRWLAYGDSITQGFCASLPTNGVIARCARSLDADIHNHAVGGSNLFPDLARSLPAGPFHLISIAYGICDWQTDVPLDSFSRNARALISSLRQAKGVRPIVLITPLEPPAHAATNGLGLTIESYRGALIQLGASIDGVHSVRGESLVPASPCLYADWVHPNDEGFGHYAKNLLAHLTELEAICETSN